MRSVIFTVFSRVWTLWAVMNIAPTAQTSIFMALACTSWALVEVPRYLFYGLYLINAVPYPIFWLRYSLFAILYPTGIVGELGCMYYAAMYLFETKVTILEHIWTFYSIYLLIQMYLFSRNMCFKFYRSLIFHYPY